MRGTAYAGVSIDEVSKGMNVRTSSNVALRSSGSAIFLSA